MEYKELVSTLKTYMTEENIKLIDKYYNLSQEIYKDMKRLTGEDYICHSIRVAKILADLKMHTTAIGCALIHEAITLNKISEEELAEQFGEETANIVKSISKLSNLKRTFSHQNDAEKYRRIVVGLSENPISLFIKLADRLDNLRTIHVHDKEHILEVVDETEKVFIPIAHRLGIKTMKSELEDLCLKNANPELYNEVLDKINANEKELKKSLLKMKDSLSDMMEEHNIDYEILYRVKSVRGIYNKLKAGKKWESIYDLLGLRLLVNKVEDCYLAIGLIHSKYRPIPKRFKDYIANPKNNMYQSLHTTIFGEDERIYEVQIRTHEMNEIAEHGVASHWSYKEKIDGSKTNALEEKLAAFRTLIEVNDMEDNVDFFKNLNTTLDKEDIYIFTPKGDVIELQKESTPIDYAYKIHSEVGNTTISALVNGKQVSLDYKLQDGDIVELKTKEGKAPSKSWLKFVKTNEAKKRIKAYFNKKDKNKTIEIGKELLQQEIKKQNEKTLLEEQILSDLLKELKIDNLDELYIGLATLKYTPTIIINKLKEINEPKQDDTIEKLLANETILKNKEEGKILIAGFNDILTTIANCCKPVPGDEIIGYITKGQGVTIHRKNCQNIDINNKRIIDVEWNTKILDKFITSITINIDSSNDNLINIITLATKKDITVSSINNKGTTKNEEIYELICKVKNLETLNTFINELKSFSFITKVER